MEALKVEKKEPEGLIGKMIAKIKLPIPININKCSFIFFLQCFSNLIK